MKEPNKGTVTNISSAKSILGDKMAAGPSAKAKESSGLEPQFSRNKKYRVEVDKMFHCEETGIKFDVQSTTIIEYSLEYGDQNMNLIQDNGYELLGPIFNVQVISGRVSAVYLPHYVCLEGLKGDKSMIKYGDFKDEKKIILITPTKIEDSYLVLENPPFSCVAVVGEPFASFWRRKKFPYNGQVLIYFRVVGANNSDLTEYRIHLYLVPINRPHVKKLDDIKRRHKFYRIDKPYLTSSVNTKINYTISGEPDADIEPETLQFMVHEEIEKCPFTEINFSKSAVLRSKTSISLRVERSLESEPVWKGRLTRADIEELSEKAALRDEEHYVDRHRVALIQRVPLVSPILDDLYDNTLTREECNTIRSMRTSQDQMRELFRYVESWGDEEKDEFLQSLRRHNSPLIRILDKS